MKIIQDENNHLKDLAEKNFQEIAEFNEEKIILLKKLEESMEEVNFLKEKNKGMIEEVLFDSKKKNEERIN